jgi:diguanylate cyclase (GGDEF)-like protein
MKRGALICTVVMVMVPAWRGATASALPATADAAAKSSTATALLAQAEFARTADPAQYRHLLALLHTRKAALDARQRWHLQLLDGLRLSSDGNYAGADPLLQAVLERSGDRNLAARATARLLENAFLTHHYVEAYTLGNALTAALPGITDPDARLDALNRLVIMLNGAAVGQYDLALQYAREIKKMLPSAKAQCVGNLLETNSLLYAGKILSSDPAFGRTIAACEAARSPLSVDSLRLNQASAMIDEGHGRQAIAYLRRMGPALDKSLYPPYLVSQQVTFAQAYLSLGDLRHARAHATTTLGMPGARSTAWIMQAAYEVLYQAEKASGNARAALAYYEKFAALDKTAANQSRARALAYQMVRQQVQAKKAKLDVLDRQNRILQLRHTLALQAQKSNRLLIALLLAVTAVISLAALGLWRSRRRFRTLARHDGLTGVYNRGHFLAEAERQLRHLHRAGRGACLAVLDLDHFKRVNDVHGHVAGDVVLRTTSQMCRQALRPIDIIGRLGGEEFGVLMPVQSQAQAVQLASRLRCLLAETPMVLDGAVTIHISASIGLAWSADAGRPLRELLIEADAMLYRAKDDGRNRVVAGAALGDALACPA